MNRWLAEGYLGRLSLLGLNADSKYIVDLSLKFDWETTKAALDKCFADEHTTEHARRSTVVSLFNEPEASLSFSRPAGWTAKPAHTSWPELRKDLNDFVQQLHDLWIAICREASQDVHVRPDAHTLLALPHAFIVPGERFRECYYWDSYFTFRGLLASGLLDMARAMVANLVYLVECFGFVPNGSRKYYLNRSQPPLLAVMVSELCELTGEPPSATVLTALLREHAYWTRHPKLVRLRPPPGAVGPPRELSRYFADWERPRPESYREDAALGASLSANDAARLYRNIASAAESGWDFSSRWQQRPGDPTTNRCTQVVPADLNALLLRCERCIEQLSASVGDDETAAVMHGAASRRAAAMNELMWDESAGCWQDLVLEPWPCDVDPGPDPEPAAGSSGCAPGIDTAGSAASPCSTAAKEQQADKAGGHGSGSSDDGVGGGEGVEVHRWRQRREAYASNWVPLFGGAADGDSRRAERAVDGLRRSGLLQEGGVSSSLLVTGEQWDAPNAWPPLQHLLAQGAERVGGEEGRLLALHIAQRYINTARATLSATGHMLEKFNAQRVGVAGGGGEYAVQRGFGWSNGVALDFLAQWGKQLQGSGSTLGELA